MPLPRLISLAQPHTIRTFLMTSVLTQPSLGETITVSEHDEFDGGAVESSPSKTTIAHNESEAIAESENTDSNQQTVPRRYCCGSLLLLAVRIYTLFSYYVSDIFCKF